MTQGVVRRSRQPRFATSNFAVTLWGLAYVYVNHDDAPAFRIEVGRPHQSADVVRFTGHHHTIHAGAHEAAVVPQRPK